MTLVKLVVTGNVELQALAIFLKKVFPSADFTTEKVDGFTSCRITNLSSSSVASRGNLVPVIDKFVEKIISGIDPGRKTPDGPAPDFVVGIDDLELGNLDQPAVVTNAVRASVQKCVTNRGMSTSREARCFERLKKSASFHLLSPMLEAYFFTDDDSLRAANVRLQPQLVVSQDVEDFESCDSAYLSKYSSLPTHGADPWIVSKTRTWFAKHPKEYLSHLIVGSDERGGIYRETVQGISALRTLRAIRVLASDEQTRVLRSLVDDLADALNVALPTEFVGVCHPETSCHAKPDRILRNI